MTDPTDEWAASGQPSAPVDATRDEALFEHPPLLESSRTKWQYGEWRDLAEIPLDSLEEHPDRAKVALLIGAAKAQLPAGMAAQWDPAGMAAQWDPAAVRTALRTHGTPLSANQRIGLRPDAKAMLRAVQLERGLHLPNLPRIGQILPSQ